MQYIKELIVAILLLTTLVFAGVKIEKALPYIQSFYYVSTILKGYNSNKKEQTKTPVGRN